MLGAQFIVSQTVPRFVMFVGATLLHEAVFQALHALVEARPFRLVYSAVLMQAVVNGFVGVIAFWLVERGPEMLRAAARARRQLGGDSDGFEVPAGSGFSSKVPGSGSERSAESRQFDDDAMTTSILPDDRRS